MKTVSLLMELLIVLFICTILPNYLYAEKSLDLNKKDHTYVIQEKLFHRYHDMGIYFSYIPDDTYYDSFGLGANYVFHFNDVFSWEIFRASWMNNQMKSIKEDIEKTSKITPKYYDEPKYLVHSQFWFRPFYGKSAVLNKKIIFHETGLFAGLGMIGFDRKKSFGSDANDTALSLSFGVGTTFFLNPYSGLSFQIRDMMHFKDNQTENRISLEIGYSFRFNLNPREKLQTNPNLENFNRYIKSNVSYE
ncbi:conserved hypothetical protein, membrane [Candidatus Magnetomorum sp. HK-1]|nr:conserved hypothetical protein, membrane [Candidatus Magnetomorum sp. HK-1]